MAQQRIGVAVTAADSNAALATVEDLERRGISAAWMTSGVPGVGMPSAFSRRRATPCALWDSRWVLCWWRSGGLALATRDIMMGTAITQTFPRHPIAVAQQVLTLAQFAPKRTVPAGLAAAPPSAPPRPNAAAPCWWSGTPNRRTLDHPHRPCTRSGGSQLVRAGRVGLQEEPGLEVEQTIGPGPGWNAQERRIAQATCGRRPKHCSPGAVRRAP